MKKINLLVAVLWIMLIAGCSSGGSGGGSDEPIVAKSWGTAELIGTNEAWDAEYTQVAMNADGNAVTVWEQSDNTSVSVWSKRYTAGTGWGTAALIGTDNAGDAQNPQVAMDASGNAVAVWFQEDGTRHNIWSNIYH